jgi:hypothetical protein
LSESPFFACICHSSQKPFWRREQGFSCAFDEVEIRRKQMKKNKLILGAATVGLFAATAPSVLAQAKGYSLPPNAQEIEPGVYYIGRVKDRTGRNIDGIAFLHPKKADARPGAAAGPTKQSQCYTFLASGARWKNPEPFVVAQNVADHGQAFLDAIAASLNNWEAAAGKNIFGASAVGPVDFASMGNAVNGANEVSFGPIAQPGVIAVTFVWGIFGGPPQGRELTEWDMILDDGDFTWSSSGETDKMDFWNIFAHESGHAAGLGHPSNTCTEETMYAYAGLGETKKQSLNSGDIAGISSLYK